MSLSLIEELPRIVREGKAEVVRIMERLSFPNRLTLQTNGVPSFSDVITAFRAGDHRCRVGRGNFTPGPSRNRT